MGAARDRLLWSVRGLMSTILVALYSICTRGSAGMRLDAAAVCLRVARGRDVRLQSARGRLSCVVRARPLRCGASVMCCVWAAGPLAALPAGLLGLFGCVLVGRRAQES